MKKDYFDALEEVYFEGGLGNIVLNEFYDNIISGGSERQFARLAVYLEWKYGIKSIKEINTEHIYELLELFREYGYKDSTLKGYISAFRQAYKWHVHLFSEEFEMPSNMGYEKWTENRNLKN